MFKQLAIVDYLDYMDADDYECSLNVINAYHDAFYKAKGSKVKHQAWEGGYVQHLEEIMGIAFHFYDLYKERKQDFSLADALVVLFLHDFEKIFKYGGNEAMLKEFNEFCEQSDSDDPKLAFVLHQASIFGFDLSDAKLNALKYIHGEGDDYSPTENVMGALATFCHCCDVWSARIWHEYPA